MVSESKNSAIEWLLYNNEFSALDNIDLKKYLNKDELWLILSKMTLDKKIRIVKWISSKYVGFLADDVEEIEYDSPEFEKLRYEFKDGVHDKFKTLCENGELEKLKCLKSSFPNMIDRQFISHSGYLFLYMAVVKKQLHVLKWLVEEFGIKINDTIVPTFKSPLKKAIQDQYTEAMFFFIDRMFNEDDLTRETVAGLLKKEGSDVRGSWDWIIKFDNSKK